MTKPTREQAYDEMLELISSLLGWYEDGEAAPLADDLYEDCADPETWAMATKRIHAMARAAEVPSIMLCPKCGSSDVKRLSSTSACCLMCDADWFTNRSDDQKSTPTPLSSIQSAIASVASDLELTQENRGNYGITSGHLISVLKLLAVAIDKEMAK